MSLDNIARITTARSRSINAENVTGAAGQGGRASSSLGPGRKGAPCFTVDAGQTLTIADIEGPGTIRHIWMTVPDRTENAPYVLRNLVLRAYWDDETTPSVEVPLGDFFCNGFGTRALVTSIPIVVAPTGGMNSYFPMPFRSRCRMTITNEHPETVGGVFVQIDYTIDDEIPADTGYFHAQWRRSTGDQAAGTDHVVLDGVSGAGTYVGTYIALTSLSRFWWGEGEFKFFLDGDDEFPTICGTGLEDYAGGAWGFQKQLKPEPTPEVLTFSAPYFGYPHYSATDTTGYSPYAVPMAPTHGLYRWHLLDPIRFSDDIRVTLQQIGDTGRGLFERRDDICTTAYWYQQQPHTPFPPFPPASERTPR